MPRVSKKRHTKYWSLTHAQRVKLSDDSETSKTGAGVGMRMGCRCVTSPSDALKTKPLFFLKPAVMYH